MMSGGFIRKTYYNRTIIEKAIEKLVSVSGRLWNMQSPLWRPDDMTEADVAAVKQARETIKGLIDLLEEDLDKLRDSWL